jgi:hypothetical protein
VEGPPGEQAGGRFLRSEQGPARDRRSEQSPIRDRRGEGFAGIAGDLLSSGQTVLLAVAHVGRRRAALEAVLAGLAPGGLPVASWSALAAVPELARPYDHLLALDPPPGGTADELLGSLPAGIIHLAWGPPEAEFALALYRSELDLRPALAETYRALRALPENAGPTELEPALRGTTKYPRSPELCATLLTVLGELELVEFTGPSAGGPACRVAEAAVRTDLDRSTLYRACRARLEAVERALAPSVPSQVRETAAVG